MIDEFCDWFEGEYDNWQQASSWPSWFAYILLEHKRTGPYTFHCEQKYKHNMEVYRTKDITVEETDDDLSAATLLLISISLETKRETSTAEPLKHRLSMVDIFVRNVYSSLTNTSS